MSDDTRADELDLHFYRALVTGLLVGAPTAWAVLTLVFSITTQTGWETALGYSALPGIVVGPFLGGLVTTTLVHHRAGTELAAAAAIQTEGDADEARQAA